MPKYAEITDQNPNHEGSARIIREGTYALHSFTNSSIQSFIHSLIHVVNFQFDHSFTCSCVHFTRNWDIAFSESHTRTNLLMIALYCSDCDN